VRHLEESVCMGMGKREGAAVANAGIVIAYYNQLGDEMLADVDIYR